MCCITPLYQRRMPPFRAKMISSLSWSFSCKFVETCMDWFFLLYFYFYYFSTSTTTSSTSSSSTTTSLLLLLYFYYYYFWTLDFGLRFLFFSLLLTTYALLNNPYWLLMIVCIDCDICMLFYRISQIVFLIWSSWIDKWNGFSWLKRLTFLSIDVIEWFIPIYAEWRWDKMNNWLTDWLIDWLIGWANE